MQGATVDIMHGNVDLAVDFADLMDLADIGMVDARLRPRLLHEPQDQALIRAVDKLERYQAPKPAITTLIDRAHAAPAQKPEKFIALPVLYRILESTGR